ncbi:MAG: hypothetical protein ABIS47_10250 [Acidimicrobiales bacterium]
MPHANGWVGLSEGLLTVLSRGPLTSVVNHPPIAAIPRRRRRLLVASEIAQRVGRTRQSVDQLVKGQRGPGDFPSPTAHATRNPLWRWSQVDAWFAVYEGREPATERLLVLGAINGALQARHSLRGSSDAIPLREALEHLLAS